MWTSLELTLRFPFAHASLLGTLPLYGSLYTLLLPAVALSFRNRRLLLGAVLAWASVFCWAMTYRVDRNLQLLLPWLVAVAAAAVSEVWHAGWLGRAGLVPLLAVHVAWAVPFFVTGGADRVKSTFALFDRNLKKETRRERYAGYRAGYRALGNQLPKKAVLLLHTAHIRLGVNRTTLSDWGGWQFLIDYRPMRTPRDVYLRYRELGITHMTWNQHDFPRTKQEDVLFTVFTRRDAVSRGTPGGHALWEMPPRPPPEEAPLRVVTFAIEEYFNGIYSVEQLALVESYPAELRKRPTPEASVDSPQLAAAALPRADAVLLSNNAQIAAETRLLLDRCFVRAAYYPGGAYAVYLPRRGGECPHTEP